MTFTLHGPRFSVGPFFLPKFSAGAIDRRDRSRRSRCCACSDDGLIPPATPLKSLGTNRKANDAGEQP